MTTKMKLLFTNTSPYARKVRIVVAEHGLGDRVERVVVNPIDDPAALLDWSPIGKVPVLVDGDRSIHDSRVICEYLDALAETPLLPRGDAAWADRIRAATGDAIADAALAIVMEGRRPEGERSPGWVDRQTARILRTVERVEVGASGRPTLGDVAVASALAYLDFRLPSLDWRSHNADLMRWHAHAESRPAFTANPLG